MVEVAAGGRSQDVEPHRGGLLQRKGYLFGLNLADEVLTGGCPLAFFETLDGLQATLPCFHIILLGTKQQRLAVVEVGCLWTIAGGIAVDAVLDDGQRIVWLVVYQQIAQFVFPVDAQAGRVGAVKIHLIGAQPNGLCCRGAAFYGHFGQHVEEGGRKQEPFAAELRAEGFHVGHRGALQQGQVGKHLGDMLANGVVELAERPQFVVWVGLVGGAIVGEPPTVRVAIVFIEARHVGMGYGQFDAAKSWHDEPEARLGAVGGVLFVGGLDVGQIAGGQK